MGLLIIYLLYPKKEPIPKEILKESVIRDSIYIVNDSIIEKIKYVDRKYDEKVSTIMSSNDSMQFVLFSEYINHYNNQRTTNND